MQAAPPCLPVVSANASAYEVINTANGTALYWGCDVGHRWEKYYIGGSLTEAAEFVKQVPSLLLKSEGDLKIQWDVFFNQPASAADLALQADVKATPPISQIPPSGLVTQSTIAYRRGDALGGNVLTASGTVPLGVPCRSTDSITNATGTYYALVDRTQAVMTKVGNYTIPRPTTIYVKCTP